MKEDLIIDGCAFTETEFTRVSPRMYCILKWTRFF